MHSDVRFYPYFLLLLFFFDHKGSKGTLTIETLRKGEPVKRAFVPLLCSLCTAAVGLSCYESVDLSTMGADEAPQKKDAEGEEKPDTSTQPASPVDTDAPDSEPLSIDCESGYRYDDSQERCADIDECTQPSAPCIEDGMTCINEPGGYRCECPLGTYPSGGSPGCVGRIDFDGPTYSGDVLLVSNESTDALQNQYSGALDFSSPPPPAPVLRSGERLWLQPVMLMPRGTSPRPLLRPAAAPVPPPAPPRVGDRREMFVVDTGELKTITATLQYITRDCEIWSESTHIVNRIRARGYAEEITDVILPLITQHFGHPSDVDGNGKVAVLFYDMFEDNIGGYFNPMDTFDMPGSNNMDIIYVNNDALGWAESIVTHELQHLVYHNRNILLEGGDPEEYLPDMWINEGLSLAAQHLYQGAQLSWIQMYAQSDGVQNGHSLLYWDYYGDPYPNYALSYLFFQYLRIRAGDEPGLFRRISEHAHNDHRAVEAVIHELIDPGMSFGRFMTEFRLALLLSEPEGPYGFSSEKGFEGITPPFYLGDGVSMRGGGAVNVSLPTGHAEHPAGSGEDVVFVGVFEPRGGR